MSASNHTKFRWKPLLLPDAFVVIPDADVYGPYPYDGLQVFGFAIVTFFPALSLAVCCLRFHSRRPSQGLGLDDWLIFIAMALAVIQAILAAFVLKTGYWGVHTEDVPANRPMNLGAFWIFLNAVLYNPIFCLIKVSALVFLLRIGGTKKSVRLACWVMIVFNALQLLVCLPLNIVQCLPIDSAWVTPSSPDDFVMPRCIRRDHYALAQALVNILTDSLTLMIPFLLFSDLHMNKRVRFALLAVFLLGILVTMVSGIRLYYVIRFYFQRPDDRKHSIGYITSTVEINLAIVTASVPSLWPLARRWFPSVFTSLGIDRPYLEPDIEVAYATRQSQNLSHALGPAAPAARKLKSKILWRRNGHIPSFILPRAAVPAAAQVRDPAQPQTYKNNTTNNPDTNPHTQPHGNAALSQAYLDARTPYSRGSDVARKKDSWFDDDDDDDDDYTVNNTDSNNPDDLGDLDDLDDMDLSGATHAYHHHVRTTEAEVTRGLAPLGRDGPRID